MVTHTTAKGISHVNEAVVNFNVVTSGYTCINSQVNVAACTASFVLLR